MNPTRWKRIKNIVENAFNCPVTERSAFIAEACGEDSALRDDVLMLMTDDAATTENGSSVPLRSLFEKGDGSEYRGMEIGPYVVERELGRGGMGLVLLANDHRHGCPVAIKLLRRSLDGRDAVVRFHYERMILSELDHPNIANVIDGGTTSEGLHFLVMEYIKGEPIDRYCDRERLNTRQRLALFTKVCQAVLYAHERKIIHRDIKPGNILVTDEGEPILLDFGIAKTTDPGSLAQTAPQTATGHRLMTPQYASPEQVKGEAISTSCDIYALGVLLYELLTGHLPYAVDMTNTLELSRAICELEPVAASKRIRHSLSLRDEHGVIRLVSSQAIAATRDGELVALRDALRGNVDAILAKALAKDTHKRYVNVGSLALDIEKHLAGDVVKARGNLRRAMDRITMNGMVKNFSHAALMVGFGFIGGHMVDAGNPRAIHREESARHEVGPQLPVPAGVAPINSL